MRKAMWAALLVAGSAKADDLALVKEEMAAIRKELVQVRMEQRRLEAAKAALEAKHLHAKQADAALHLPEVREAIKADNRLKVLQTSLAQVRAEMPSVRRVVKPESAAEAVRDLSKKADQLALEIGRREASIIDSASAGASAELVGRSTYLTTLKTRLEKDLAKLEDEAKKLGK